MNQNNYHFYNSNLKNFARFRRKNQTPAEIKLWSKLRNRQFLNYKVYRQRAIDQYIVDFLFPDINLIIEIDGSSHDHNKYSYDRKRELTLVRLGYKIIRFSEYEIIKRLDDALTTIEQFLEDSSL